jgi:hypothetical protein
MKNRKWFVLFGTVLISTSLVKAQAPDLSAIQQLALARMEVSADLTAALTAAQSGLVRASLTLPANAGAIQSAVQALGRAETALANARADQFQMAQASLDRVTTAQAVAAAGGGGRGGRGNAPVDWKAEWDDMTGFTSLFNGRDLTGWNYETDVWMFNEGAIHSDNVNNSSGQHHIHFTGLPGVSPIVKDFHLKVEFKIIGGNGGIHYRSRLLHASRRQDDEAPLGNSANGNATSRNHFAAMRDPLGKRFPANVTTMAQATAAGIVEPNAGGGGGGNAWQISGYQFDITGNNTASLYEGQGRGVVANSGETIILAPGGQTLKIGKTSDIPYQQFGRPNDWNYAEVIARGNVLVHMLNGRVFMIAYDDDPERRAEQGILSLQLEGTGQIWYRQVYLKNL